jgi:hypothetical protein
MQGFPLQPVREAVLACLMEAIEGELAAVFVNKM